MIEPMCLYFFRVDDIMVYRTLTEKSTDAGEGEGSEKRKVS